MLHMPPVAMRRARLREQEHRVAREHYCHGMGVLIVQDAGRAVGQRAGVGPAAGNAAGSIEPLDGARDIGERDAIPRIGVQLRLVMDDQMFIRRDRCRRRQHREIELAVGSVVAERVVGTLDEQALGRGDAVCRKDLCAQDGGCRVAHAARRDVRQHVTHARVPGVAESGVLDVQAEVTRLSQIHRRWPRLREHKRRVGDREHYNYGVGVLIVQEAGRAVGQRAGVGLTASDAAVGIEPLDGARDVG